MSKWCFTTILDLCFNAFSSLSRLVQIKMFSVTKAFFDEVNEIFVVVVVFLLRIMLIIMSKDFHLIYFYDCMAHKVTANDRETFLQKSQ